MPEKAWKQAERTTARKLGGERTPLSGSNSKHTSADGIFVDEYLEHKRRKTDTVHAQLSELGTRARRQDRWPAIVYDLVDEHGPRARWVALWLDRYLAIKEETGRVPTLEDVGPRWPWLCVHEVGRRLAHAQLVLDTVDAAEAEGRPPLIVISRHRSPNRVALVPLEVVLS